MSEPDFSNSAITTEASGLSQIARVTNIFLAPSKTFEDIRDKNRSWWLPLLLFIIIGTALWWTVTVKVGWSVVLENSLRMSPTQAEQLANLPPDIHQKAMQNGALQQNIVWACAPIGVLLLNLIAAGVLLGTINFVFGGKANFSKVLAVSWYAGLLGLIKLVLGIIMLWVGASPDSFLPQNPAPTNLGYFMSPPAVSIAMWGILSTLDIVSIWMLVLFSQGLATVAGTKRSSGYITVFGWWAVMLLVSTGFSLAMGR